MPEINKNRLHVGDTVYVIMSDCHANTNTSCPKEKCEECGWQHLYISSRTINLMNELEKLKEKINEDVFLTPEDAESELRRRGKRVTYSALS